MNSSKDSKSDKPKSEHVETPPDDKKVVMCWKDTNKVCQCGQPQQGVYCGRYPLATD